MKKNAQNQTKEKPLKGKLTKESVWSFIRGYLVMTLAGILNATSIFMFIDPAKLIAGGFTGLSQALAYIVALFIDIDHGLLVTLMYIVLNIPLLICSLIFLRGDFTFKTIWATLVSTGVMYLLNMNKNLVFDDGARLISIIFGGIIIGSAMYVAYEYNGSNGGTEVIGRIVNKYKPEQDISKVILVLNFTITVSGSIIVIIMEGETFQVILYSLLYVLIGGSVLGVLKRGINLPQKCLIITAKYEEVGAALSRNFQRGFSVVDIASSADGQKRKMISVLLQYRQMTVLKNILREVDPQSFTIVKDVYDVFSRLDFNRSYKIK